MTYRARIFSLIAIGVALSAAAFDNRILMRNRASPEDTRAIYAALNGASEGVTYAQTAIGSPRRVVTYSDFKKFVSNCTPIEPFIAVPSFRIAGQEPTKPYDLVRWDCPKDDGSRLRTSAFELIDGVVSSVSFESERRISIVASHPLQKAN